MEPKDFSNPFNRARQEIRYAKGAKGLSRKRQIINAQIINAHLEELDAMYSDMIENAVQVKETQGFPEANVVIAHIRAL